MHGDDEEDDDPLRPDPLNLDEFKVENNKFAFSPGQLGKLINPKNLPALRALGGIEGLERGLRTDLKGGLSLDETVLDGAITFEDATREAGRNAPVPPAAVAAAVPVATVSATTPPPPPPPPVPPPPLPAAADGNSFKDRLRVFKDNRLPERKSKSLLELMWIALNDKVLLLLSAAAVISLALGLYQTFGGQHDPEDGPPVDWVEGVAIIVAILIVVVVGAGNDWQKERQFVKLNKKVTHLSSFPHPSADGSCRWCCRKKIAPSRSSGAVDLSKSPSMTSSSAISATSSPET